MRKISRREFLVGTGAAIGTAAVAYGLSKMPCNLKEEPVSLWDRIQEFLETTPEGIVENICIRPELAHAIQYRAVMNDILFHFPYPEEPYAKEHSWDYVMLFDSCMEDGEIMSCLHKARRDAQQAAKRQLTQNARHNRRVEKAYWRRWKNRTVS